MPGPNSARRKNLRSTRRFFVRMERVTCASWWNAQGSPSKNITCTMLSTSLCRLYAPLDTQEVYREPVSGTASYTYPFRCCCLNIYLPKCTVSSAGQRSQSRASLQLEQWSLVDQEPDGDFENLENGGSLCCCEHYCSRRALNVKFLRKI